MDRCRMTARPRPTRPAAATRRSPALCALFARLVPALLALLVLGACGGGLPGPPTTPHTADDPAVVVPFPPPPARVEIIPPQPATLEAAVWLDGEWQWRGSRWVWLPGRWEVPYPGARFAPATVVRRADGALVWFSGVWHFPPERNAAAR